MRQLPALCDFTLGEVMPIIQGKPIEAAYHKAASSFINFRPYRQGGFGKCIGTLYQGHTASDGQARLIRFVVNQSTAYVAEFTNNLIRFWKWSSGALSYLSGKDIPTTYTTAELNDIQTAWTYPYFFIVHQNHAPAMITWASGDSFTYSTITFSGANAQFYTGTIASGTSVTLTVGSLNPDTPGSSTYDNYKGWAVTGSGVPEGTTISAVSSSTSFTLSQAATNASGVSLTLSAPYVSGETPALPFQSSGNYPAAVCVAFQRLWLGNTTNEPLALWVSIVGMFDAQSNVQMGTYETITYQSSTMDVDSSGQPTANPPTYTTTYTNEDIIGDSDGIKVTINSDRNDEIRWLAPDVDLFVGTASAQWVIQANATANTIAAQIVSRSGNGSVPAAMVEGGCVFTDPFGRRIGQIGWRGIYNPWIPPDDLTFFAQQIFDKNTAIVWDFQQSPETMLWFVRSDGQLAALLMDTTHQVRAWWHRTTNGTITSLCVIPGDDRDVVVLAVTRNGHNLVEVMDDDNWYDTTATNNGQVNANYLDAAVTKSSATAFTSVTGLDHLDGLAVGMVGDGAYLGTATVASGSVTLPTASKIAHVGLEYTADFDSMPLEISDSLQSSIGLPKGIVRTLVRLVNTLDFEIGPTSSDLQIASLGGVDVATADPALFTGDEDISINSTGETPAYIHVRSSKPLPCNVAAIEPEVNVSA